MKKLSIYFMLLSSIILLQCTKEDNPNGPGVITDLPVYIQPTQPGYIQTSATSLVLRAGNSATVNAKLYKSDGTVEPIQPTFLWSTQDSSVALVNNGIIQAVGKGQAEIAVSDSIHGISYITVSVLSTTDTITVPGGIYSISYSQPVVILQKGGSKSITYRLNNSSGQQIGGTIDAFMVDPASGITVSNTGTITAGQTTGIFYAYARVGTDTIGHPLRIVVFDPAVTNTTPVYDMRVVLAPTHFYGKNKRSRPVRIEVTESFIDSTGTPNVRVFQTSPTRVELNESGILELESTGRLKSLDYGAVKMTIYYHNKKEHIYARVFWIPDGYYSDDQVSLCVQSNFFAWGTHYWTGPLVFDNTQVNMNFKYLFIRGIQQSTATFGGPEWWDFGFRKCVGKSCSRGTGKSPVQNDTLLINPFIQKYKAPGIVGHDKLVLKFISEDQLKFEYGNNESHVLRKGTGDCIPIIIITNAVTAITPTTATTGGTIDYSGTSSITSRGVVWNTSPDPTLRRMMNRTTDGTGTGSFTSTISGLSPLTTYYVNTYAISSNKDTVYGTSKSFTTPSADTLDYVSIDGVVTSLKDLDFQTDEELDSSSFKIRGLMYGNLIGGNVDPIHYFDLIYKGILGTTPKNLFFRMPAFQVGLGTTFQGINDSNLRLEYGYLPEPDNTYVSSSGTIVKINGYALVDGIFKKYEIYDSLGHDKYRFIKNVTFKAKVKFPY